ncbi:PhzF family phenazine biosynthesis protein [Wenzhouxiangella marina]|uniref:Phenazine biosynthesis protein PhzF family n=1 Tax=Wenzhouxiangella marina TaxID=1579979 RepID=A0A0K0XXY1_9GAMM|nr:PhzF family phenazine biosynthesis protein [Wenzhouxiangella marina]AKS42559.1 Phenazine biosynthesis protein PhzF family [Wenzhouxiangella marina]MBB6085660.1 PhzF family phenazine biosynthesis protein [Wenzhouxiangella marina]
MELKLFQVDAFADRLFEGNPAAVVPLEAWLPDGVMQAIAMENNLSETAFFVREGEAYQLRWFTPEAEVDLCGHATLASAHVLFEHLGYSEPVIRFLSRSGELTVEKGEQGLTLDFPAIKPEPMEMLPEIVEGLGAEPVALLGAPDYVAVFESEEQVRGLEPDFAVLKRLDRRGVLATAPGKAFDFVSRCFFPKLQVDEDPVTGSAHCKLVPYWAERLGKTELIARQASKRGGTLLCELAGDRVRLTGRAVEYLRGTIWGDWD